LNKPTAFLADPIAKEHDPGRGHPEQPARWDAAVRGVGANLLRLPSGRAATESELALCHTTDYIRSARSDVESGLPALRTGDTDICPRSYDVALRATGTVLDGLDLVLRDEARNAFCIVRPPGHHATPTRGMGFCLFNNIAIAARYARHRYGVERVAIADWDVHHGNGTQDTFYSDPSVFFFSTHEWPLYPGTGAASETGVGRGKGTTLNCPFPAGSGHAEIVGAFKEKLVPRMAEFKPDLVLVSAGFDSRKGDPLGHFRLTDDDFATLTEITMAIAHQFAGGRLISVLEGGYNLTGLESAVRSHSRTLATYLP
jgi:acetoin utilization deacetylase AcuC-like enzyme